MVMNVMGAVCVLLQEPTDWNNIKRVMASLTFLKSLTTYDTDKVTDKVSPNLETGRCMGEPILASGKGHQYYIQ